MKLQPKNTDRVPRPLRQVQMECQHVQAMRKDGKSHDLWLCGYLFDEACIITRECDECAAKTDG
jgi:hypothetical protein